jgi:excisionase family DNA binding protein
MRRPKAGRPEVASAPQAPDYLGARPLAEVLAELAAVLQSVPPERLAGVVVEVLGVVVREAVRPLGDALAGAQRLQDARSDGLLNTQAAARVLGVHPWTVRQAIECGELPSVRIGRCLRIKTADLDAYVLARRAGGRRRSGSAHATV